MKNKIAEYFKSRGIEFEFKVLDDCFRFYFELGEYSLASQGDDETEHLYGMRLANKNCNLVDIAREYNNNSQNLADFIQDFNEYHKKSYDRIFERMEGKE